MSVYLIHFDIPYKHARHYIGYTRRSVKMRIAEHRTGRGARLMAVIVEAGITFRVAKVWYKETRKFERKLKNRGGAARICPICNGQGKQSKL